MGKETKGKKGSAKVAKKKSTSSKKREHVPVRFVANPEDNLDLDKLEVETDSDDEKVVANEDNLSSVLDSYRPSPDNDAVYVGSDAEDAPDEDDDALVVSTLPAPSN